MRSDTQNKFLKIGFLVIFGLIVLGLAILGITSKQRILERKFQFYSLFPDATGLKEGSSVTFQGVEVGFVTDIEFLEMEGETKVKVTYKVSSKILPFLNSEIVAEVKNLGLLGDKFISLQKGEGKSKNITNLLPGSEIKSYQPISLKQLGENASEIMASVNELSKNINDLVLHISKEGPLAKIMNDPKLSNELVEHYRKTAESLDIITSRIKNGEGVVGGLFAPKGSGDESAMKLRESIDNLNETIKRINEGKGVLGLLITEFNEGKDARESLIAFFKTLDKFSKAMEDSDSLLHKLFVDEEFGKEFSENLMSISLSLSSILKKIDKGEGSVGALINDKDVYNSLALTTQGIQKSKLVKWYLKKKANDAVREELKKGDHK